MPTIVVSLIVFGFLVFFHELGHFLVAKLSGIKVLEFSIGFGPKIFKFDSQETSYSLGLLPLGGYVKMEGEDEESKDPRGFSNKPPLTRIGVIAAGPIMNLLLAILLMSIIGFYSGTASTKITVIPGEPAAIAGIKNGDRIYAIDKNKISSWEEIITMIGQKPGEEILVTVVRDDHLLDFKVKSSSEPDTNRGVIGIKTVVIKHSISQSLKSGIKTTFLLLKLTFQGLVLMILGRAKPEVLGPVGLVHIVGEAAKVGVLNVLYLAALISINLGFFNLLPIPALDGSRIVFLGVELIRGRPIEPEKEGMIHFIGFTLLMILMVFILFKDVSRLNLF